MFLMIEKEGYTEQFQRAVEKYGGFFNAHLHSDRGYTSKGRYLAHASMNPVEVSNYPLHVKQDLVGDLHRGPAYTKEDLEQRIEGQIKILVELGTRRADSLIDTTADNVELTALKIALEKKEKYRKQIDLRFGAYPIFGFKDDKPERWKVYEEGAKLADYLGGLPERDDKKGHSDHIGYHHHLRRIIILAKELGKEVHVHVDQGNVPNENGTEQLVEAVKWLDYTHLGNSGEPAVWAVHAISPSTYDENRFKKLLDGMIEFNIGVICCPSAALSMKQHRDNNTPTYNSIARVKEMLAAGIPVRVGSDNVEDVFVPAGTLDLSIEFGALANAVRFYNPDIWAKVAAGIKLTKMDMEIVRRSLD